MSTTTTDAVTSTEIPTTTVRIPDELLWINASLYHPYIFCHTDFNVTIDPRVWSHLQVNGEDDAVCSNDGKNGALQFNLKTDCNTTGAVSLVDSAFVFSLSIKVSEHIPTNVDRKYEFTCNYSTKGDAHWSPEGSNGRQVGHVVKMSLQNITATRKRKLTKSRAFLVSSADTNTDLPYITVGDLVKIKIVADDVDSENITGFGVTGCSVFGEKNDSSENYYVVDLIDSNGCNTHPTYWNPFRSTNGKITFDSPKEAYSDSFTAFKFPGSTLLYLICTLDFCVNNDTRCGGLKSCSSRRRRSVSEALSTESEGDVKVTMSQVWVMDKGWKLEIDDQGDDDVRPTTKRLLLAGWDCDKWSNNLTYLSIFLTIGLLVAFLLYCKHRDTKSNRQILPYLESNYAISEKETDLVYTLKSESYAESDPDEKDVKIDSRTSA